MKGITHIEKIISRYGTWKPSDIAFIKAVEWKGNSLVMTTYSQLRAGVNGWPDTAMPFFEISFSFTHLHNLKLDFPGSGLHQVSGFDIVDISGSGIENINFQIEDYENNSITFTCREVNVNRICEESLLIFSYLDSI